MSHEARPTGPEAPPDARASYAPPRLVRYGSIVDLTAAQQPAQGALDGGLSGGKGKFSFLKSA